MPADNFRVAVHSSDYFPNIGGVATHVHELTSALIECGITAGVVTIPRPGVSTFPLRFSTEPGPPPVLRLPKQPPLGARAYGNACRSAVRKLVSDGPNDDRPLVFHSHWFQPWWVQDCQARVFTNHTSMFLQDVGRGRAEKWKKQLSVFDAIIAPSTQLAESTIALGVPSEKVRYIPNAVNSQVFRPDASTRKSVRQRLGISEDAIVLLCARRIVPKNGIIDFAHSLRFVEQQIPQADLDRLVIVIAGNMNSPRDNGYQDETLDALAQTKLGQKAHLLGEVPNPEMPQLFAAADCSILPSLKEATSIAGLEAMAAGVPLVGTRVGGIPDLISDHEDGILVEHGNPVAFAAGLVEMITKHEMRREMGTKARDKAVTQFSWKSVAERTIEVYRQALESSK